MPSKHFAFIDALRGYAILGVIASHAAGIASGARGVQLFFVASALTLAMSWESRHDGLIPFYIRRLFRIAPMFWIGVVFFTWLDGLGPRFSAPHGIDAATIVLTLAFLNGWHPETINSVVPGGWSIAVEVSFYLLFPLLLLAVRSVRSSIIAFALTFLASILLVSGLWLIRTKLWPEMPDVLVATFLSLWLPTQLPVFVAGLMAYFLIRERRHSVRTLNLVLAVLALVLVILPWALSAVTFRGHDLKLLQSALYGLCFCALAVCLSGGAGGTWLVNRPIQFLGKVSFSAYLIHFALLESGVGASRLAQLAGNGEVFSAVYFIGVLVVTTGLSWVTYTLIERPMIAAGRKLIAGRAAPQIA